MPAPAMNPASTRHDDALRFLLARIDYERTLSMPCSEKAMKLGRMRELLERLGNPQKGLKIVHVAGTKGKGSTSAMIAAVLAAAGHRTGLFTSPHIERIEERIVLDGRPCSSETFAALVERVRHEVEAMDQAAARSNPPEHGPTYFEILTAMAFCHFQRHATAAVLEVGLGGRLDSTNVCSPCVSIITSISLDHTQQLGKTLAAIAAEKAGILKPGVPVVSGVIDAEPRDVIRRVARERGCRLLELGVDFDCDYVAPTHMEQAPAPARIRYVQPRATNAVSDRDFFELGLLGRHQAANAATALAAIDTLRRGGMTIPDEAVRRGLVAVRWPARIEVLSRRPTVVLDAAHNAASIAALLETLAESFSARKRFLVFATTQEKDLQGMLRRLAGQFDRVVFTRYVNNPRGVAPEQLLRLAGEMAPSGSFAGDSVAICPTAIDESGATAGLSSSAEGTVGQANRGTPRSTIDGVVVCATPGEAWEDVRRRAGPDDLVCITGSFFLAAEIRHVIAGKPVNAP